MPARRKNNAAYIPTKTAVRAHHRTVYKRKPKQKFDRSNFVKKTTMKPRRGGQRGGFLGTAKTIGSVLWEVGKPAAKEFWNQSKRRAAEHKENVKRHYYYGHTKGLKGFGW